VSPSAALLALACYVAAPAPLVRDEVHRALRDGPVAVAPAKATVSAAARGAAAMGKGGRHGR
jgi:hypothetical protein